MYINYKKLETASCQVKFDEHNSKQVAVVWKSNNPLAGNVWCSISIQKIITLLVGEELVIFNEWLNTQQVKKKILEPVKQAYWAAHWREEVIFTRVS